MRLFEGMLRHNRNNSARTMSRRIPPTTALDMLLLAIACLCVIQNLLSLLAYSTGFDYPFAFTGIGRLDIPYGDLVQLTYTAGCETPLGALADGSQTCDPSGRPFNLMFPALFLFKVLGINSGNHTPTGAFIGITAIISLACFCIATKQEVSRAGRLALFSTALACFPMQLALERGNTDLVIFTLICWFCLAFNNFQNSSSIRPLSTCLALSTFSILFKLWSGPGLILIFAKELFTRNTRGNTKAFWGIVTITALISIVFLGSYWSSGHVFRHTEAWEGHVSFGINATYYSPQFAEPGLFKQAFRTWKLALASIAAFFTWRSLQAKSPRLQPSKASITHTSLTVGYLIYACVYFLSKSWDYRLICMIFCLPYFFSNDCIASRATRVWAIVAMAFTLYELYIPVNFLGGAPESLSDLIAQPILIGLLGSCVFHKQNP